MKYQLKFAVIVLTYAGSIMATSNTIAANWLMLQGTEPAAAASRAKLWGFIQAQYQNDRSKPGPNGNLIPPKLINANLTSRSQFNVNRARIGIRGTGMPLDSNVNYFLLAEFGNNAITNANEGSTFVTDASITLNHFKSARIRLGMFKVPTTEEGLAAVHVFDYINYTTMTNQLMLERHPNAVYTENAAKNAGIPINNSLNKFDRPVGAFRDTGLQIFDTFTKGNWEFSYALMVGNGNGLNFGDNDDNKDTYFYLSTERVFNGKGPFRQGLKLFAWNQSGKRLLDQTDDSTFNPIEHKRKRSGIGFKYFKKPWRATVEFMKGEGMIFVGPDKPTFDVNGPNSPNGNGANGKASGYYIETGYYFPNTAWQIDFRYDVYNRLENDKFETEFNTSTLGVNYMLNKKTRMTINVADVSAAAINFATSAPPNLELQGLGQRYSIQVTHVF